MRKRDLAAIQFNMKVQTYLRAMVALVAGSSAGYLGLKGFEGLYYWIVWTMVGTVLEVVKSKANPSLYFENTSNLAMFTASVFISQLTSLGLTFVLFWTFFYNIIHVYN